MRHQQGSFTKKPCHGCGASGTRSMDKVCRTCQARLKYADACEAQAKKIPDEEIVAFNAHGWPYVATPGPNAGSASNREPDTAGYWIALTKQALSYLVESFPEIETWQNEWGSVSPDGRRPAILIPDGERSGSYGAKLYKMPRKALQAFRVLHDCMERLAAISYREGVEYGQDILGQLARGDISVATAEEIGKNAVREHGKYRSEEQARAEFLRILERGNVDDNKPLKRVRAK